MLDKESEEKLLYSIGMPQKPRLGSLGQWILFLIYLVIFILCTYVEVTATETVFRFYALLPLIISTIGLFVEFWGIFVKYVQDRKDYRLAELDFPEYRRMILKRISKDYEMRKAHSEDLKNRYGKRKTRYPFNPFMGGMPNGKIRP